MGRLVQKFGGTTVADIERIRQAAEIAVREAAEGHEVTAVVSAMGRSTEQLLSMANQISPQPNQRELDMLLATGDQVSGALLSMAIQSMGWSARSFTGAQAGIVTELRHGAATIKDVNPEAVECCLSRGEIAVVAGIQGTTEAAEITTLGPGGSDTTAVALSAALGAQRCDVYTDVRGIFTADPHVVQDARCLPALSYEEMMELSAAGADLLSTLSLELALDAQVPIRVRASHQPDDLGTLITNRLVTPENTVCAVALDLQQASISLKTPGTDVESGLSDGKQLEGVTSLFTRLQELNIATDMIMLLAREDEPAQELALTVNKRVLKRVMALIETLSDALGSPKVSVDHNIARISVIGRHLTSRPEVVAAVFDCLNSAGIPLHMVSTVDMRISMLLPDRFAVEAVKLIHNRFKLSDGSFSAFN